MTRPDVSCPAAPVTGEALTVLPGQPTMEADGSLVVETVTRAAS